MVDKERGRRVSSGASKSYKSSSINSEFGLEYRVELEDKYLQNCLEFRPPSGTNHQQPGSHLSVDTRLSELSLSHTTSASSKKRGTKSASSKNRDPHRIQVNKPNYYITSPFKQGYQNPKKESHQVVDPGHELKSVTRETIARVRQQFRRPQPPCQPSPYSQRLRKAKFKSTGRPISGSGPSIRQCQGVQAGHRVVQRAQQPWVYYQGDQSRLYSHSNRPDSPTELLRVGSSIHCTSRASSKVDSDEESPSEESFDNCNVDSWIRHSHVQDEEVSDSLLSGDRDKHCPKDDEGIIPPSEDVLLDTLVQTNSASKRKDRGSNEPGIEYKDLTNKEKEIGNKNNKEKNVRCKPFSDGRVDLKDDDDDENTDNPHGNRVLSCQRNISHACPQTNSTSTSVQNDGSKEKGSLSESLEELQKSFESGKNIQLQIDKEKKLHRENENQLVNESVAGRDRCLHIVDSSAGDTSPVMRVHFRGKLENDTPFGTGLQGKYKTAMSDIQEKFINRDVDDVDDDDYDDIDYDDDDLDSDRIPSAEIWKNLGQLNLSTNDYHNTSMSVHSTGFPLKARKVHSAGANRKPTTTNPNYAAPNVQRMKQAARTSRSQQSAKTHSKKSERIDKVEMMRKYLLEESKRFSAELRSKLPGYFTEQFNIIQHEKSGLNIEKTVTENSDSNDLVATAVVKSGGEEEKREEEKLGETRNEKNSISDSTFEVADGVESDQVSPDIPDPTSSGVFFTVETTRSCESVSGRTEDTVGNESWNEFSDDTGFETMPGKGVPGDLSDDGKSPFKSDCRQDQVNVIQPEELEIVAKAKILTDPKHKKYAVCPYEPLTFDINARPPAGYVFYFAYGVDMNIKRMSIYLRGEHKRLWGVLYGFKLRFNKKGSSTDAGGFANIEFSPGSSVEGCVYTITDAELSMLDNCMGYPKHYTRAVLPVWMCNCHEPSLHGVAQYCVPAVLYVAEQRWIQSGPTDTLDYGYSVSQCLKATDILTPNYVDFLQELAADSAKPVVLA